MSNNKEFPKLQPGDIIELHYLEECRFMCNDEVEQFDGIIHPDEDDEFYQEQVSRVWRLTEDTYYCIFKKSKGEIK